MSDIPAPRSEREARGQPYNPIFEILVNPAAENNEELLEGLVAYGLYKQAK
jgi:hypothetical protein